MYLATGDIDGDWCRHWKQNIVVAVVVVSGIMRSVINENFVSAPSVGVRAAC